MRGRERGGWEVLVIIRAGRGQERIEYNGSGPWRVKKHCTLLKCLGLAGVGYGS